MKKLYMMLLVMVMLIVGATSVFATEVEAATTADKTEKDSDKIYFPWEEEYASKIVIPLDYKYGGINGKTYYNAGRVIDGVGYGETYKLTYSKTIITAKAYLDKETGATCILVQPKKVGTTTIKVVVSKKGFNTFTRNIKVVVGKKKTEEDQEDTTNKNIYRREWESTKEGKLIEYNKLFLFELNKVRLTVDVKQEIYRGSEYEYALAREWTRVAYNLKELPTMLLAFKEDKTLLNLTEVRYNEIKDMKTHDEHEGMSKYNYYSEYEEYDISEELTSCVQFRMPIDLVTSYRESRGHWGTLNYSWNTSVSSICYRNAYGTLVNITHAGGNATISDAEYESIEQKYEYLMTPEEREINGVDNEDETESAEDYYYDSENYDGEPLAF